MKKRLWKRAVYIMCIILLTCIAHLDSAQAAPSGYFMSETLLTKYKAGLSGLFNYSQPNLHHVRLIVDGEEQSLTTSVNSVGELLDKLKIYVGSNDLVIPGKTYKLNSVETVRVIRVKKVVAKQEVVIPYQERRVPDSSMYRGSLRVTTEGQNGYGENKVEIIYQDGKEVSRSVLETVVIEEPQDRVVYYGTMTTMSRGGRTYTVVKSFIVEATAYTAGPESTGKTPDHPEYGLTCLGIPVEKGHIAVDPRVIPFRSEVYIEGLDTISEEYSGKYLAADSGSAIKGSRIDIYMDDLAAALRFGRRKVRVYVLN